MQYFRTLDKEKVISILEEYKKRVGEYPTTNDLKKLKIIHKNILPSVKWMQRQGGIFAFYNSLGLNYTDARTGARRSGVATVANKKAQSLDVLFSQQLVKKYGEANVHWQSPYNKGLTLHRSDFRVYKPDGTFFFLDLFFPKDIESLIGGVNIKLKKLSKIKVENDALIYFVSCNELDISPYQIEGYLLSRKSPMPKSVKLLHISDAIIKFAK